MDLMKAIKNFHEDAVLLHSWGAKDRTHVVVACNNMLIFGDVVDNFGKMQLLVEKKL